MLKQKEKDLDVNMNVENEKVEKKTELPDCVLNLPITRMERRQNQKGEPYYMVFLNMCVRYDTENMRNNRYLDIPFYMPKEVAKDIVKQCGKNVDVEDLKGLKATVNVEFNPQLYRAKNNVFCDFTSKVVKIKIHDYKQVNLFKEDDDEVPF